MYFDPTRAMLRPMPLLRADGSFEVVWRPSDEPWSALGSMLDMVRPRGLGIVLPIAWQQHRRAYVEARARNIIIGVAPSAQAPVLTGIMEEVPIEAVVATEEGARSLEADLTAMGMLPRIRGWLIVGTGSGDTSYRAASGATFYDILLWRH